MEKGISIYHDDALVGRLTREIVSKGHRILQSHKFGNSDREHVATLLQLMDPPGPRLLDLGCGVGEMSRLMKILRPDLEPVLLNLSEAQLEMCPDFPKVCGKIDAIPCGDSTFDAALLAYALGHGSLIATCSEVARVLRPGGHLLVYDIMSEDPLRFHAMMDYYTWSPEVLTRTAGKFDLETDFVAEVGGSTNTCDGIDLLGEEEFKLAFGDVTPIVYRFVRT